jgi:hypothetical protein
MRQIQDTCKRAIFPYAEPLACARASTIMAGMPESMELCLPMLQLDWASGSRTVEFLVASVAIGRGLWTPASTCARHPYSVRMGYARKGDT